MWNNVLNEKNKVIDLKAETFTTNLEKNQNVAQWLENQNFDKDNESPVSSCLDQVQNILYQTEMFLEELRNNEPTELMPVPIFKIQKSKTSDDPNIGTPRKSPSDFLADDNVQDPDFLPNIDKINNYEKIDKIAEKQTSGDEIEIEEIINNNSENVEEIKKNDLRRKRKKRIKNMDCWKRNLKKQKINSGKEYVSRLGKLHKAKSVPKTCGETCLVKCSEKVPAKICRKDLFNTYYQLADKTLQREFLSRHNEKRPNKSENNIKGKHLRVHTFLTLMIKKLGFAQKNNTL
ncbi:unnamed protein product [Psylliodes chrysocephalus]|uniref:Uncharacterized protein n=1 Tax=Psylliodes chrysocephalus TaxID=3402493 RepID=A0A9P0CTL0_9CUCU|nr:unnamed protein product [Psylliodes chrysocephala]